MRYLSITIFVVTAPLYFIAAANAQDSGASNSPPWNTDGGADARCHVFAREAEPALAWFLAHPEALDSWIEELQSLCFTDDLAESPLQRDVAHRVFADVRSGILDRVQPYQEHPEYSTVASRIVAEAHAIEVPYR